MTKNPDTSDGWTYYPGPGIVVTSVYIVTRQARYRVRDLEVDDPHYFHAHPNRTVALYCGLIEVVLALGIGAADGTARAMALLCLAGVIAGAGLAAAILLDNSRNPRRMVLTAWHEGARVVLFTSTNHRVFEQVRRAVVRAVEANRPMSV